jgi:hypothetical protein
VNWVVYGANGFRYKSEGLVIERFVNHTSWEHYQNRNQKMIVNPRMAVELHIHLAEHRFDLLSTNARGEWNLLGMFDRPPIYEPLRLNHYWSKSLEEFAGKRARGGAVWRKGTTERLKRNLTGQLAEVVDVIGNDPVMAWCVKDVKEAIRRRYNN